jgi:hypothetical protein
MQVTLQWMPAIDSRHGDRRALAGVLREQIAGALSVTE